MDNPEKNEAPGIQTGDIIAQNAVVGGDQTINNTTTYNTKIVIIYKSKNRPANFQKYADQLQDDTIGHPDRQAIGHKLAAMRNGDPRPGVGTYSLTSRVDVPNIAWCAVETDRLYIARYPVTVKQYQAFCKSNDFKRSTLETLLGENLSKFDDEYLKPLPDSIIDENNCPVVRVTWYQAMAFCCWLTTLYSRNGKTPDNKAADAAKWQVQLPSVEEWKQASGTKLPERPFPWGAWEQPRCNTLDSDLKKRIAAGLYPKGAAPCGAEDMIGNVWELTRTTDPDDPIVVLAKGGAYSTDVQKKQRHHAKYPDALTPYKTERQVHTGFRPVWIKN
jgi:hypothetical protein